jgi:hypothetical protein
MGQYFDCVHDADWERKGRAGFLKKNSEPNRRAIGGLNRKESSTIG